MAWTAEILSPQGARQLLERYGPQLVAAAMGIVCAVQLGVLLTPSGASKLPTSLQAAAPAPAAEAPLQLATIVNAHLFGAYQQAAAPDADNAPQTSVPLFLTGIMAGRDPAVGMAIIGADAQSARLYSTGALLPAGVRLHSVYADRVVLDRNGALESLLLPKVKNSVSIASTPTVNAAPSGGQRLQAMAQNNPSLLGGLVRTQAVFNQGKLSGYRIFPSGRSSVSVFSELGLRSGDLITAVNGASLDDPSRSAEVLQTLSSSATASVTVSRNGQAQEINLNLETAANEIEAAASEAAADDSGRAGRGATPGAMPARIGNRRGG